jgi:predicted HTH transcriptional regulator
MMFTASLCRTSKQSVQKTEKLTPNQRKIIALMSKNNKITIAELSKSIGISETAIDKNIKRLKDLKFIDRKGGTKDGNWEIGVGSRNGS